MRTTEKKIGKIVSLMFGLFMVGLLTLSSCSSDGGGSNENSGNNYVILDGMRYAMKSKAYYTNFDIIGKKWVVLSVDNDNNTRRHFNIAFEEKQFVTLNSGTYTFKEYPYPNNAGAYNPNIHFSSSDFNYNCTGISIESCDEAVLISGTVTITKNENSITIDLEGMTDEGAIEAHYEGVIEDFLDLEF